MKRSVLGMALAASVLALSGAARADDTTDAKQMLRDWVTAENEHDAAALDRILDDNFISTFEAGKPTRKAAFIRSLTKGKADPKQSQSLTDETVIVEGDTAILVGTDIFHRTDHAEPDGLALRYTITATRKNGRWVALSEHIVKMPK